MAGLTVFFFLITTLSLGACVFFLFRYAQSKRTPVSNIGNATPGPVKVFGIAVARDRLITSEFSNENCLYFKFTIREDLPKGFPKIRYKREENTPFLIKGSTGSIDVDFSSIEFILKNVKMNRVGGPFSPDEEMQSLLNRHDIKKTLNNSIRAEESILLPDTPIIAMGHLKLNPDGTRILSKGTKNLLITDKSESELAKGFLIYGFIAFLIAVIFIVLFLMIKKPEQFNESRPPLQTNEYNDKFYE